MNPEWFSAKELIGFTGLPSSPQGIHSMARRQKWVRRRRFGVQGRGVEYHIDSLPIKTNSNLVLNEPSAEYFYSNNQDPLLIWIESYKQLDERERQKMITFIVRNGMIEVINRLGASNEFIY
ncbi:DNA-binding protein [Serratia sp. M24T3]|uniref:DNA-binding protein n=1 Tax=Serratia sp. M24T3 TaxID=932213 RepID=UPI00025B9106|nr:DNA-binding protein [Serratia sp. M24T3]EIC84649.1 MuA-transposase/repressor protein CI DNA-binding protein [Serratia sp. M24T3]